MNEINIKKVVESIPECNYSKTSIDCGLKLFSEAYATRKELIEQSLKRKKSLDRL